MQCHCGWIGLCAGLVLRSAVPSIPTWVAYFKHACSGQHEFITASCLILLSHLVLVAEAVQAPYSLCLIP